MSSHNEMPMQDASAGTDTTYSFMPDARGSYNSRAENNMFNGDLGAGDEDWVAIELKAGTVYTITVAGTPDDPDTDVDESGLNDPILTVYDSKGGMVDMNDDVDGAMGDLSSKVEITPDSDSVFYIAVSAYSKNPESENMGAYTVMVAESEPPDPSVGTPIPGTPMNDKLVGTDLSEKINGGEDAADDGDPDTTETNGDDSLYGMGGDDTLQGGSGNDLLVGGPGSDVLQGGTGIDTISYAYSMEGVRVNLMTGVARGGEAGGDSFGDPNAMEYTNDIENVQGSMHNDEIVGDGGDNKLWGRGGDDELSGGEGMDTLDGGMGDDELDGGDDDDTLMGGYGADELTGGDGMDTASYMGSMAGVTVRLHNYRAMGGDAEGDTFAGRTTYEHTTMNEDDETVDTESSAADIEHLTGSDNDDILAGDGRMNTIMGMGGDDKIYGGPGGDADSNEDTLDGGAGNDMIFGGAGDDTLMGGAGDDMLWGGPGTDTYDGGAGNDMIYVDLADITNRTGGPINGGSNLDEDGVTPINEGMGVDSDTVSFEKFTDEDEGVTGVSLGTGIYANIENAIGTDFDDEITANVAGSIIEGGGGDDMLNGGAGNDTLSYASSPKRVRIDLAENDAVGGHATGDTITGFENVIGTAYDDVLTGSNVANALTGGDGDDELVGGDGGDMLSGGAGEDSLEGGVGDDTLEGGAGADELDGGDDETGANTLSYAGSDAGVAVNLATASVSSGHAQGDEIAVIDDVDHDGDDGAEDETPEINVATFRKVTGSDHNDSITGDYRMNVLMGMGGDDTIRGGAGWDMLVGGPGADRLDGGESGAMEDDEGTQTIAEDVDWAVYRHATEGGVTVNLDTMMGEGGDAMGDVLVGIELVWGSDDMENGDTFIASAAGADMIHGDLGPDTLSYEASTMGVRVDLDTDQTTFDGEPADAFETVSATVGAGTPDDLTNVIPMRDDQGAVTEVADDNVNGAAGDRIGGIQNLTGSAHDDTLTGDGADNTLMGGGGDDMLNGAAGMDTLSGGAGEDTLNGGDGADMLDGGADDDTLNGDGENDMLSGGAGDDTLDGGAGDDTLAGGTGDDDMTGGTGNDTFLIGHDNGDDYIISFEVNNDDEKIDLQAFDGITSFDDLTMRVRGGNTVIDLSAHGGDSITLVGITTDLDANDFIFVL